jgi:hypothetical protein
MHPEPEARAGRARFAAGAVWWAVVAGPAVGAATPPLPSLDEALAARRDVWGEAAMAQPNGASYEFVAPLLPPPRYVNADFRHYPIVLSAPRATVKARLISDGSGVNLPGGARSWNDVGTAAVFRVGPDEFRFGALVDRLEEPTLAEGWLPIVEVRYRHASPVQAEGAVPLDHMRTARPPEIYALEAFASTEPAWAAHGAVAVKFSLAQGTAGTVSVDFGRGADLRFADGRLTNAAGEVVAIFDRAWRWERNGARARVTGAAAATLAILTQPMRAAAVADAGKFDHAAQRGAAVAAWQALLAAGMRVEVPEPRVQDAWRALVAQNFALIHGDRMHYSAGNQYDRLYEGEGSDAALALMSWGHDREMRRLIGPLLDFTRRGLEIHQAGFKLTNVARLYWQTRDADTVRALRPKWAPEVARLADGRTGPHGLYPAERYTGDISTPVQAIGANAHAWRALRDFGAVLGELGETAAAAQLGGLAAEFRRTVRAAIDASVRRETAPPFVPVALHGAEPAHDPILRSRIGSYWNITIGYTIGSGIFPPGSAEETWIARYQENHGGLLLGLVRSGGSEEFNFWTGAERINPLYGLRYTVDTLRRDEPERGILGLYGMLAHGFTRNTFVAGEAGTLLPVDARGRMFYCPPNSAGNAHFLTVLRHLLVQDWDLTDDGVPETLRLLFATPRRWLEDGKTIVVDAAPTAFGPVSVRVESRLSAGEVWAQVQLPTRNPAPRVSLRVRVPDGWRVRAATANGRRLAVDAQGTVDLDGRAGAVALRFDVEKR